MKEMLLNIRKLYLFCVVLESELVIWDRLFRCTTDD